MSEAFSISANIVDITARNIFYGDIFVRDGIIEKIEQVSDHPQQDTPFAIPGFIDAHVHIESSLLIPSSFARMAVVHGTVATVSDPHEIANVCGMAGVEFMIENGKKVPFKFNFGAPSCVPATIFETAGACLNSDSVAALLQRPEIRYLSEMMNFPGVLSGDPEVMTKIEAALKLGKPIDGHAPGLMGNAAQQYIDAGISTDHECFTTEEALDKLRRGMKVIIREGSAARNFDALIPLLSDWYAQMMFCSDDKHPDSLEEGHINSLCARAVALGIDIFQVLQVACVNPVVHYKLSVGLLKTGDPADFALVKDLTHFHVIQTWINGQLVAEAGKSKIPIVEETKHINHFNCERTDPDEFKVLSKSNSRVAVIEALDGQLITNKWWWQPAATDDLLQPDISHDVLKIAVVNRYNPAPVAVAFIKNFGLQKGALASSVAHDSHNIVAVGVDDSSLSRAVNLIIESKGGLSATDGTTDHVLPLPVAGLMSAGDGYDVAESYKKLDQFSKLVLGSSLRSPFMTLSFMALLVIPHLKLSDKGLFDGDSFTFVS